MPKMNPTRRAFKTMIDMIHGQESFLHTNQCRAWIRDDIRQRLIRQLESLEYCVGNLHATIAEQQKVKK